MNLRFYFSTVSVMLIIAPIVSSATPRPSCPAGLEYIDTAYAEDTKGWGEEAKVKMLENIKDVLLPRNFQLDRSYRMSGGSWSGGYEARPVTDTGKVPDGLAVLAFGETGGHKGWAVGTPTMYVAQEDDEGKIIQRGYKISLYCHSGSGETDKAGVKGCNVGAVFCAKRKE